MTEFELTHQLEMSLFVITMAIAVVEVIYWTIVGINRIIDFIFKTKNDE